MPDLLLELDDRQLSRFFDRGALARGRHCHTSGAVQQVRVLSRTRGQVLLAGEVWGTAPAPYQVQVRAEGSPSRSLYLNGYCSCPVAHNCKHAVAVVLAARTPVAPSRPMWERRLQAVLEELDGDEDHDVAARPGLGLQLELKAPGHGFAGREAGPALQMRPVRRGAKDNWVKTGISWNNLAYGYGYGLQQFDPGQVQVLKVLYTAASQHSYSARATTPVSDVGVALWPLLEQARDAGVELVPAGKVRSVTLTERPVTVRADVTTSEDEGLHFGLLLDGADLPGQVETISVLGDPGHGLVVLLDGHSGQRLVLARLSRPLPRSLALMLEARAPVVVPPDAATSFVRDYLPRLTRHLPTGSSDGSVVVPEQLPPALVARVEWHAVDRAELSWHWRYQVGEETRCFALDDQSPAGVRLRREEAAHAAMVAGDLSEPVAEALVEGRADLRARVGFDADRVLELADVVLPELRQLDAVEVEEATQPPDYRAAEGAPEVRFDAAPDGDDTEGRTDWLDLQVVITVDGEQLQLASVLEALTLGQDRVFLPSGLHVSTDRPELAQLGALVLAAAELTDRPPRSLRVARDDLGLWGQLAELGIVDAQAAEWVRAARALRDLDGLPDVTPVGLSCELRPYQLAGFRWLSLLWQTGLGGILADDMGLGKTLQALALVTHARSQGAGPFLVVAPTSVVSAWQDEAVRHAPALEVRTVTSVEKRRGFPLAELVAEADVVVTSYTLLRLEAEQYAAVPWGGMVLDEAQAIKNHQGKTYQAVRRIEAPFRLAMTGTPFENRLLELWALLSVVAPGLYPWPQKFAQVVAHPVERRGDEKALARFRARIAPFLLRRTKEVVAQDLPPKQEQVLRVELGGQHRRLYDTHLQRERQKILGLVDDFQRNRIAIFGSLTRLRQLSLHAGLLDERHLPVTSAKIDVLMEHLRELADEGHRALVFSSFTTFLGLVRQRLQVEGLGASYLDGRTRNRAAVIDRFRSGDDPVFLISLKAGGVGLTLTEADYVFVLDPWWNPATEAQAVDRVHRIGQERPVFVYRLISADTIEEKVMALKERKAALFQQVIEGDGVGAGMLDADDVRALFG